MARRDALVPLLAALLLVGASEGAEAQRLAPVAVRTTPVAARHSSSARSGSSFSVPATPATPSRTQHAAWGALAGAVAGGLTGWLVGQSDHTGEGLAVPVVIAGGALLGLWVGALIGAAIPTG